jgi:protein-disulfide isomerase
MIDTRIVVNTLKSESSPRGRPRLCARAAGGLIAAVAALALAAPVQAGGRSKKSRSKAPKTTRPVLGSPTAKVKIVVYGDMQCPFTRILMTRTLPRLVKAYPKKVQVIWRDNPLRFHRGAMPAAVAGREVFKQRGSKAFYAFQKLVFANMRIIDATNLAAWAKQVGADSGKVSAALTGTAHRAWIKKDQQSAASRGARGTPTSFVNGQKMRGSQPYDKFKAVVDSL